MVRCVATRCCKQWILDLYVAVLLSVVWLCVVYVVVFARASVWSCEIAWLRACVIACFVTCV